MKLIDRPITNSNLVFENTELLWPDLQTSPSSARTHQYALKASKKDDWLEIVVERLNEIVSLSDGWAGPRSKAVTPWSIYSCLECLGQFMSSKYLTPSVLPTPEGGIELGWHAGGWNLELEFDADGDWSFWGETKDHKREIAGSASNIRVLENVLGELSINARLPRR